MSDRYEHPGDGFDASPPKLDELDAYLESVGARWRATSTEIGSVASHLRERASHLTAEHATHATMTEQPAAPRLHTVSAPTALHRNARARRLPLRLVSSLVAVLAIVAIVGALAALLLSVSGGRGSQQAHGTSTTASGQEPSTQGRWVSLDKLDANVEFDANDLPAIAPSDPRVVYETMVYSIQQHKAGSLRLTDDGGATWHTLPLPIPAAHVGHAGILVSPVDPRNVFLYLVSTDAADCPAGSEVPLTETNTPGAVLCWLQYTSTDGGTHWTKTKLPYPQTLSAGLTNYGTTSIQAGMVNGHVYLYALLGCSFDVECQRLIGSADGGKTWNILAAQLLNGGRDSVRAVISDQRSATVFVITSPVFTSYAAQKPLTLWRSDDAGIHWSNQGTLATPNIHGAMFAHGQGANSSLLYLALPRTAKLATDKMGGKYPIYSSDPSDLKVSADGGKTWQSAPAAGIPSGLKPMYDMGIMGTLSDGSVVVDYVTQNRDENFEGSTLFAWKPGDASWRQLAPPVTWEADTLLAVPGSKPGADTLYLTMTNRGESPSSDHPTFGFLRYTP